MRHFDLFILHITNEGTTSGVDRYIEILIKALNENPLIRVFQLSFIERSKLIRIKKTTIGLNCIQYKIPFPIKTHEIIEHAYWLNLYNDQVLRHIGFLFESGQPKIIHSNTLNLIDFAMLIRKRYQNVKIISHLHCIPWKGTYDYNLKEFISKYKLVYSNCTVEQKSIAEKIYLPCEFSTYKNSDKIICLSQSGQEHVQLAIGENKIVKVYNGIEDRCPHEFERTFLKDNTFHCLFVGSLTPSKGFVYVLDALEKVTAKGFSIYLIAAGLDPLNLKQKIQIKHKSFAVDFVGLIPYFELEKYYLSSDCGIIASMHEQNSYAAIEMMMNGMPIITTNADGLDEMFDDGINAIKIPLHFNTVNGLYIDTDFMAEKIIYLINNADLQKRLAINSRKNYLEQFSAQKMIERTMKVFNQAL